VEDHDELLADLATHRGSYDMGRVGEQPDQPGDLHP
jgi:hypothetical protein